MKQGSSWFLAAALLCTLLAGCSEKMPHLSATEGGVDAISPEEDTVMRCRGVAVDGENQLLLFFNDAATTPISIRWMPALFPCTARRRRGARCWPTASSPPGR